MTYQPKIKILNETSLCRWLDLTVDQVDELRRKQDFPFVPLFKSKRVYIVTSVLAWLEKRKTVITPKKRAIQRVKRRKITPELPKNWGKLEKQAARRDGYKCQMCGIKANLSVHHIMPRAQGGTDDLRNLITLCKTCHDYAEIEEITQWNRLKLVK